MPTLGLVGGVGLAEHGQQVRQRGHDRHDLVSAHPRGLFRLCALHGLVPDAFGFGFGDPPGDRGGVCAGVER